MEDITVTVASSDPKKATAVIRVEVNGGAPRIANINVIAAENQSLSTARMPDIDFEKLLAAVLPSSATPAPAIRSGDVAAATIGVATRAADSVTAHDPIDHRVAPTATGRPARVARTTAVKNTTPATPPKKTSAPKTRAVKKSPAAPAGRGGSRKAVPTSAAPGNTKRHLMPDDFADVYHQAPHRAAIADHFGVKDHTAQSWINTARKRGLIPPARRRG